jgi:hypothetical protein
MAENERKKTNWSLTSRINDISDEAFVGVNAQHEAQEERKAENEEDLSDYESTSDESEIDENPRTGQFSSRGPLLSDANDDDSSPEDQYQDE